MGVAEPVAMKDVQSLDVLHIVGESIPFELSDQAFVLYQNIYPPVHNFSTGLVLPAATFAEEDGTFTDHSGQTRNIHQAIKAPGSALPSWQILCRLAQKLEVPGFAFENVEQIRAEMAALGVAEVVPNWIPPEGFEYPATRLEDHVYMGFPLRTWVAGLRVLYPEPVVDNA